MLELETEYATYESRMKEIFQNIINGRLFQAGESLLHASIWLLEHVEELGKPLPAASDLKLTIYLIKVFMKITTLFMEHGYSSGANSITLGYLYSVNKPIWFSLISRCSTSRA